MLKTNRSRRRLAAAIATGCAGLALAGAAQAVDLRDWGKKYAASERYVVLSQFNNQAVLDKETQLVWQRAPSAAKSWPLARVTCIESANGGRQGWRLPTISELTSLMGLTLNSIGGYLPAGHPFQNVSEDYLWSSTDFPTGTTYAFTKSLLVAHLQWKNKSTEVFRFLCVRGVGTADY